MEVRYPCTALEPTQNLFEVNFDPIATHAKPKSIQGYFAHKKMPPARTLR